MELVTDGTKTFSPWDYVVFAISLVVSTAIGVFFGCTGGKQRTTSEFLLADRKMHWFPVTLSLLASFMSAVTVLGNPSESYNYGTMYSLTAIPQTIGLILSTHLYHPVFYRLKLVSVYEYLELRFHKSVRVVAAVIFIFQMLTYMAVVLYGPSLALSAVTGLNVWIAICSVGFLCTIYTAIGGIKAVMWTDVFQIGIMFAGLLACLIRGSIMFEGFDKIWQIADEGGRLEFFNTDFDPRVRTTVWGIVVGGVCTWIAIFGVNQSQVQRILSCADVKTGRIAVYLNIPGLISLLWISMGVGLVCYATYLGCDPVLSGEIMAHDQLFPKFVMDHLSHIPALPGLFVAAVFCASLSTLSSGMNSLAAVAYRDIGQFCCEGWSDKRATIATKLLAFGFGLLTIGLTILPYYMGSILTWSLSLFGMLGGPLVGVFTVGLFLPWVNWKGALSGLLTGLLAALWVVCGAQIYRPWLNSSLPRGTDLCPRANETSTVMTWPVTTEDPTTASPPEERGYLMEWYAVSYLWYGPIGMAVTSVVSILVSACTGFNRPEEMDPRVISPVVDAFCCCLPASTRRKLWCGVRHGQRDQNQNDLDAAKKIDEHFGDINGSTEYDTRKGGIQNDGPVDSEDMTKL